MGQIYKVFNKRFCIELCSDHEYFTQFEGEKWVYLNRKRFHKKLDTWIDEPSDLCIYGFDLELLWEVFKRYFKTVKAGGGLVKNDKGDVLMIFRNGVWDFPKGKIEPGEDIESCAIREVKEECGLKSLFIERPLPTSYHLYKRNGRWKFKPTFWYEMSTTNKAVKPQKEEGIEKVEWVAEDMVNELLKTSFRSLRHWYSKVID